VLTKHDLPSAQPASELADRLRRINPDAPVRVNDDEAVVDMAAAIAGERLDASGPERAPAAWMIDALARSRGLGPADATGVAGAMGRVHTSSPVETFVVRVDGPTPVASVSAWLENLVLRNASRLLRLKGVVSVTEQPDPIVVHAVRNLFHPSTSVPRHANDPGGTRLVVIVDNAERRDRRSLGREVLGPALFEACERGQVVTIPMPDAFPA
jgi:G3E family GTPase